MRTRFSRCPMGNICPHSDCTFLHRNNLGRLTRHWRSAHPNSIMPEATIDQPCYDRRSARIRQHQCPHHDCTFQHQRSMNRLNAHLEKAHSAQPLSEHHHLPHNMVPCHQCNGSCAPPITRFFSREEDHDRNGPLPSLTIATGPNSTPTSTTCQPPPSNSPQQTPTPVQTPSPITSAFANSDQLPISPSNTTDFTDF